MASLSWRHLRLFRSLRYDCVQNRPTWDRKLVSSASHPSELKNQIMKQEIKEEVNELATNRAKEILQKEFPDYFRDGEFISRMSYVEFIDEALSRMKSLGINKDLNAYKELLKVFPPGKYYPMHPSITGLFNAPQQLAALRVYHQLQMNKLRVDKDFEKIILERFSNRSDIWLKAIRANYWSMKGRNIDPNPLPEKLPKEPHQLAKLAVARMLDDRKSVITVTNTSKVPASVDKTWIVYSQSPTQKGIIDELGEESVLYIEGGGLSYVGENYLAYYHLKYYVDDETRTRKERLHHPEPDFDYNTLKVQFFGKPIRQKYELLEDTHYADGCYILSTVVTGTSSQDSLLSWLKILQQRNPKLAKLNVVFKQARETPEMIEYQDPGEEQMSEEEERAYRKRQHNQSTNMLV